MKTELTEKAKETNRRKTRNKKNQANVANLKIEVTETTKSLFQGQREENYTPISMINRCTIPVIQRILHTKH